MARATPQAQYAAITNRRWPCNICGKRMQAQVRRAAAACSIRAGSFCSHQRRHDCEPGPARRACGNPRKTHGGATSGARRLPLSRGSQQPRANALLVQEPVSLPPRDTRAGRSLGLLEIRHLQRQRPPRRGGGRGFVRPGIPDCGGFGTGPAAEPPRIFRALCAGSTRHAPAFAFHCGRT